MSIAPEIYSKGEVTMLNRTILYCSIFFCSLTFYATSAQEILSLQALKVLVLLLILKILRLFKPSKMIKVLIVEDELIIAADMESMLVQMGYEVLETAMDYDEAIETLENDSPDLILLDVNLGGKKDGIDLAQEINTKFQIPFIFKFHSIFDVF